MGLEELSNPIPLTCQSVKADFDEDTHSHTYLFISHGRYFGHSVTNEVKAQP